MTSPSNRATRWSREVASNGAGPNARTEDASIVGEYLLSRSIAELRISQARRWLGVAALAVLGVILAGHGLLSPERGFPVRLISVVLGAGCLWQAWRHLTTTRLGIVLTEDGLFDGSGDLICGLDNIGSVDRGMFAFKPTNGFLIRLRRPAGFRWIPGLYWRVGKRIGVGGATQSTEAKVMADRLTILVDERSHRL